MAMATALHRIVVARGGAGGLELATALGDSLGRRKQARITLIDKSRTHFWKPLLHEVAAGSMDLGLYELSYAAHGHAHAFTDCIGEVVGLDRQRQVVQLAALRDEAGELLAPLREVGYDTLVLAVGSRVQDFGTPGVRQYAITLDSPLDAERFHQHLINACLRAHSQAVPLRPEQLQVAIIGAGATGVELAAQLHHSAEALLRYGLEEQAPTATPTPARGLGIHLIEAEARVLPALPPRFAEAACAELVKLGVKIYTHAPVQEVDRQGVRLADGSWIAAELGVWAAGIQAPDFLPRIEGLECNPRQQLLVGPTLQTTRDAHIFAIGDCAACHWPGHREAWVPARAQAAHQQALHLARQLPRQLAGKPLQPWRYRDHGSLVALGAHETVANLLGSVVRGGWWLEGYVAWLLYESLALRHQLALHGLWRTALDALAHFLTRRTGPQVKLH